MPDSISIWRAQIGSFFEQIAVDHRNKTKFTDTFFHYLVRSLLLVYLFDLLINFDKVFCFISKRIFAKKIVVALKSMTECKTEILSLGCVILVLNLTLILLSNDVEQNPGPTNDFWATFPSAFGT